ncbi:DUF5667 domain-containing protein [Clostridium thailandense]|uniref:DUF5667 domain-containing protein n=1 Tax=Clostridium thailandense TaxID=2794346 RepID=UPI003988BE75
MKKVVLFVAAIAVSLSITGKVFADENSINYKESAGITPDNIILYPIDKAIDNLKVNIASDEEKKAEALKDVAIERLGESEIMVEKGKTDLSVEPLKEYNDKISEAQEKVETAVDNTSTDNIGNKEKLDKLEKLEAQIVEQQKKNIEVLQNLEKKLPEKAKDTIDMVIEMQTAKKDALIAVLSERKSVLQSTRDVTDAEKKLEEAKKSGNDQSIKAAEDLLKQKEDALKVEKDKLEQVVTEKKEVMKGGVGKLKKELKEATKKESSKDSDQKTSNTQETSSTAQQQGAGDNNLSNVNANTTNASTATSTTVVQNPLTTNSSTTVTDSTSAVRQAVSTTKVEVKENKEKEVKEKKYKKDKENKAEKENKQHNED